MSGSFNISSYIIYSGCYPWCMEYKIFRTPQNIITISFGSVTNSFYLCSVRIAKLYIIFYSDIVRSDARRFINYDKKL